MRPAGLLPNGENQEENGKPDGEEYVFAGREYVRKRRPLGDERDDFSRFVRDVDGESEKGKSKDEVRRGMPDIRTDGGVEREEFLFGGKHSSE